MQESPLTVKYTLFSGPYLTLINQVMSPKYAGLLRPRVLWLEWQTIPVPVILRMTPPELVPHIFFLPIPTRTAWSQLVTSSQLTAASQWGFQTLIVHIPTFQGQGPPTAWVSLRQLSFSMQVIILTDDPDRNPMPQAGGTIVEVETDA